MSVYYSEAVWENSKATGTTLLVLLALADHANIKGYCWPGVSRLAEKCRVSERTIQRCLRELEELEEIKVYLGKGRPCSGGHTNCYWLNFVIRHPDDKVDTPRGDNSSSQRVTPETPTVVTGESPKPSVDPSVNPSKGNNITKPVGPSGQIRSDINPLNFSPEKERTNPEIPTAPLPVAPSEEFCDAIVKLRELWIRRPVPPLAKQQRDKIRQLFRDTIGYYSLKKLLWIYIASWSHWQSVRKAAEDERYVEGFTTKFFWPPEQGFKHLGKVEDYLFEEARKYNDWYLDLMADVKKVIAATSTLTREGSENSTE